jgi:hypothetical protein
MHILRQMTEEKLEAAPQKPSKRGWFRLFSAALLLIVALLVLFRQPIAGWVGQAVCAQQKLTCRLKITRADFGGVTLTGIDVRDRASPNAALSADRLAVDFDWSSLFSPRARSVGGDQVVLRLDLSGKRPILGDLDAAVKHFTAGESKPGPIPQLDFKTLRVIGDTPLGPVEAHGKILATGPDAFAVELNAPPARLGLLGATLELKGADLNATVAGGEVKGQAKVDLAAFEANDTVISDLRFDVSLDQTSGVLRGAGSASMGEVSLNSTKLASAQAKASIESAAVDPATFDFAAWLANVRSLSLNATAGAGTIRKVGWGKGVLTVNIKPRQAGGSGGDILLELQDLRLEQGAAGRIEVVGKVDTPKQGETRALGTARLQGAALTAAARKELASVLADPFEAALPKFGAAAARAADRAGQGFEITLPWAAVATDKGIDIAALTGSTLKATSGLTLTLDAATGAQSVVSWNTEGGGRWMAAGSMRLSGGGGPQVSVDLAHATGAGQKMSMAGALALKSWRVGDDVLDAEATGLEFNTTDAGGSAAGQFTVRLDGGLAGGVWKGARATGEIKSAWTPNSFFADAPRGLVIQWDQGRYGETVLGASALHYLPQGRLAELSDGAVVGLGALARVEMPVKGGGYSADVSLGQTAINWRAQGGLRAGFDAAPTKIAMKLDKRSAPITIQDISGILDVRSGWRVTGALKGGEVKADEATVADLGAKFDLGGSGGAVDGGLSDVTMRVFDPLPESQRRYEETKFAGSAKLKDSVANFSGQFTLAKPGVQIASVSGSHSLETGTGSLTYAPTPLIFLPKAFQPYHLSPLLRGPANVTGRVDISGGASWSNDGVKANATVDLRKIGFALSTAGVFEGVTGKVVVSDLLNMASDPNQTITIDKVTLGMPIEKGAVRFRLIGYDAIRLEGAEWPFVGGFIRIKPTDFKFSEERNGVIAQAVNWDLNKIVELFKIPDVKLNGIVSGDIPITFSTGSARIDKAELVASQTGGVIQYTGSTGDAAAQADSNAKMLFDALKDFRYKVLKLGLNGDIAGRIELTLNLLGSNPTVLGGSDFQLNISVESPLMNLLNLTQWQDQLKSTVKTAPAPD